MTEILLVISRDPQAGLSIPDTRLRGLERLRQHVQDVGKRQGVRAAGVKGGRSTYSPARVRADTAREAGLQVRYLSWLQP